jgi:hypothetical protein
MKIQKSLLKENKNATIIKGYKKDI